MPPTPPPSDDDSTPYTQLSAHLRELALRLVADEASADDLVQEAWLASLDARPDQIRDLNRWLHRVVRNIARRTHKRALRRRDIESLAADAGTHREEHRVDHRVEIASTHRMLVARVDRLGEPYRSVLRMRFVEGREVAEIAAARGTTPATVRSQVKRGLAQLRQDLDRSHDGIRESWKRALVPLIGLPRPSAPPAAAENAPATGPRSLGLGVAAAVSAVATVTLLLRSTALDPNGPPAEQPPVVQADADRVRTDPNLPTGTLDDRVPRESTPALAAAPQEPELAGAPDPPPSDLPPTRELEVLVRRRGGAPAIEGVVLVSGPADRPILNPDDPSGYWKTDLDGRALLSIPEALMEGPPWFPAEAPGVTVVAWDRDEAFSMGHRVSIPATGATLEVHCRGPAQDLVISVLDTAQQPIQGAVVILQGTRLEGFRGHDSARITDGTRRLVPDEDGALRVYDAPMREHQLLVFSPDYPVVKRVVQGTDRVLNVTLVVPEGLSVYGRVSLADGSPAAGARVWKEDSLGALLAGTNDVLHETRTDADGFFELRGLGPGEHHLFATDPANRKLFASTVLSVDEDSEAVWEPTLTGVTPVRVRLVKEDGEPAVDGVVLLEDPGTPAWKGGRNANADGRALFLHTPDRPLVLSASVDNRAIEPTVLEGVHRPPQELVVTVTSEPKSGSLRGKLLDATGQPPDSATLVLADGPFRTFDCHVDPADGSFEFEGIGTGTYAVAAHVASLGQHRLPDVTIEDGADLDLREIRLPPPREVPVEWRSGSPSADRPWQITAELEGLSSPWRVRTLIGPTGSLRLLPGTYAWSWAERPGDLRSFRIDPGGSTPAALTVGP